MKIGIYSDLHLEFANWDYKPDPTVDLYINAGDTHPTRHVRLNFFERHPEAVHILGNHDYWGDVTFYQEETVIRYMKESPDGLNYPLLKGATLWTDLSRPEDWFRFCHGMRDQKQFYGGIKSQLEMQNWHTNHKNYLLEPTRVPPIIVSHHLPSYLSVHKKFHGSTLNASFATELGYDILALNDLGKAPKLWIHGHTHEEFDYFIGSTRVICHPRGYPGEGNWKGYQPKIIEMDI